MCIYGRELFLENLKWSVAMAFLVILLVAGCGAMTTKGTGSDVIKHASVWCLFLSISRHVGSVADVREGGTSCSQLVLIQCLETPIILD